jgi:hypothetical protein
MQTEKQDNIEFGTGVRAAWDQLDLGPQQRFDTAGKKKKLSRPEHRIAIESEEYRGLIAARPGHCGVDQIPPQSDFDAERGAKTSAKDQPHNLATHPCTSTTTARAAHTPTRSVLTLLPRLLS